MPNLCMIPNCENELSPKSKLLTCSLCRSSQHRWEKRRPAEILERRRKLRLYDARMEDVIQAVKPKTKKRTKK